MAIIAKYKFNPSLCADYLPTFNREFTGYTKTDVNNGDGTITRTISHDTLKPTSMRFGVNGEVTDREKSLIEVIECDTSNMTSMFAMFQGCSSLTSLNTSNFNTDNITNISSMFSGCSELTSLNLSSFNTSKVTNMNSMFNTCSKLALLDVSNFDTSKVTNMSYMFNGCNKITSLDLSNFNTSKVTSMVAMFQNCSSLTTLDLSNFNTSNVTSMANMFNGCNKLISLDLSSFDTSKVTTMANMFNGCNKLISLDLSSFDTSKVTGMGGMFGGCSVTDVGLLYATSSTINTLLTHLGTSVARNIYYIDAPLNELTVQNNITYKEYKITKATLPYTLNKLPNGVADYIDVVNKVHVQRVGIATVIGDNMRTVGTVGADDYRFEIANALDVNITSGWWGTVGTDLLYTHSSVRSVRGYNKSVILYPVNRNITLADFQTVLQANPVTVLYPLSTPIYTPLTEEEIAQLPLSAYKDGYINLSSDQLTPSFEFRMRASNRYQVDMLETGYYYLNAPTGNIKLGTASVDVQQMPCIVKVDNVGTGDSGYRLNTTEGFYIESSANDFVLFNQRLSADGSIVEQEDMGITDYYNIPLLQNSSYIFNYNSTNDVNVFVAFYDTDKNHIKTNWHSKNNEVNLVPVGSKYARLSYNMYSGLKIRMFTPITLAKLPSHRIPSSFTQGMKCGTNFGYWEGIKEAQISMYRTYNGTGAKDRVDLSKYIQLNRIESGEKIVEDEFDIATGKLTKRVGVKLVTVEDVKKISGYGTDGNTYYCYGFDSMFPNWKSRGIFRANGVNYHNSHRTKPSRSTLEFYMSYIVGFNFDLIYSYADKKRVIINELNNTGGFTVYYELEVPEISYVNLPLYTLKTLDATTTLQVANQSTTNYLLPQVKPSHLAYPVPSLVGNRTYTVVHNRKNISGSTKPIELNLGGTVVQLNDTSSKTLVKTPSTLAHSNLIFIGGESTVDHVMVLDGDWTNKPIEYFENMKGHDTDAIITIIGDGKIDDVAEQYLW